MKRNPRLEERRKRISPEVDKQVEETFAKIEADANADEHGNIKRPEGMDHVIFLPGYSLGKRPKEEFETHIFEQIGAPVLFLEEVKIYNGERKDIIFATTLAGVMAIKFSNLRNKFWHVRQVIHDLDEVGQYGLYYPERIRHYAEVN